MGEGKGFAGSMSKCFLRAWSSSSSEACCKLKKGIGVSYPMRSVGGVLISLS